MKIQVYSDIHLDHLKNVFYIEPKADYLFLAGDIGHVSHHNFKLFFDDVSKKFKKVFYVLGNHEYYYYFGSSAVSFRELYEKYREFFVQYDNVHMLKKDIAELEEFTVLGCTLWSNADYRCEHLFNDFRCINIRNGKLLRKFKIDDYNKLHQESLEWLKNNYDPHKPTIIMTHHPTTSKYVSHPMFNSKPAYQATFFCSEIEFNPTNKLICISGHTHYSFDFVNRDTRYISNQKGYKDEEFDTKCVDKAFGI